jgi:hypothetical protein
METDERRQGLLPDCEEWTGYYRGRPGIRITVELDRTVMGYTAEQGMREVQETLAAIRPARLD